jgi:hypothetical protein
MNPKNRVLPTDKTNPDVGWALPTFIALDDFNVFLALASKALHPLLCMRFSPWAVPTLQNPILFVQLVIPGRETVGD